MTKAISIPKQDTCPVFISRTREPRHIRLIYLRACLCFYEHETPVQALATLTQFIEADSRFAGLAFDQQELMGIITKAWQ